MEYCDSPNVKPQVMGNKPKYPKRKPKLVQTKNTKSL